MSGIANVPLRKIYSNVKFSYVLYSFRCEKIPSKKSNARNIINDEECEIQHAHCKMFFRSIVLDIRNEYRVLGALFGKMLYSL